MAIRLELVLKQPSFVEDVFRIADGVPDLVQALFRLGVEMLDLLALAPHLICQVHDLDLQLCILLVKRRHLRLLDQQIELSDDVLWLVVIQQLGGIP